MAKPELGIKRLCPSCGTKYYDLNRDPITCPKCGHVFLVPTAAAVAASTKPRAEPDPAKSDDTEEAKGDEAEVISLEDADAEQMGDDIPAIEDDEEVDTDIGDDSNVFLDDEDEDGDADVPGIVVEVDDDDVDK